MRRTTEQLATLALLLSCSCSSAPSASACPDLPSSCTKPAPSYKSVVAPIIRDNCVGCHGGGKAGMSMATYAGVSAQLGPIHDEVEGCAMPPAGYSPLSALDRQALVAWLACGAPDN